MKHPILGQQKAIYFYASTWNTVVLVHASVLKFGQNLTWEQSILDSAIFNFIYAALALSFWYTCKYSSLTTLRIVKLVENHLFAAAFSSSIWLGLSYAILAKLFGDHEAYIAFLKNSIIWRGLIGVLFYFLIIALYYIYIYSLNLKEQSVKQAELKT
ncbi:MAG: hypothetical protein ACE5G1_18090, partial [bacterium]